MPHQTESEAYIWLGVSVRWVWAVFFSFLSLISGPFYSIPDLLCHIAHVSSLVLLSFCCKHFWKRMKNASSVSQKKVWGFFCWKIISEMCPTLLFLWLISCVSSVARQQHRSTIQSPEVQWVNINFQFRASPRNCDWVLFTKEQQSFLEWAKSTRWCCPATNSE